LEELLMPLFICNWNYRIYKNLPNTLTKTKLLLRPFFFNKKNILLFIWCIYRNSINSLGENISFFNYGTMPDRVTLWTSRLHDLWDPDTTLDYIVHSFQHSMIILAHASYFWHAKLYHRFINIFDSDRIINWY